MSRKRLAIALVGVLLLANLAFIWGNSALPGAASSQVSGEAMNIFGFLVKAFGPLGEKVLRKIAHMAEFACLGLLAKTLWGLLEKRGITAPVLFGLLAACVDETIQAFISGRSSSVIDVWVDLLGLMLGIALALLGQTYLKKQNHLEDTL